MKQIGSSKSVRITFPELEPKTEYNGTFRKMLIKIQTLDQSEQLQMLEELSTVCGIISRNLPAKAHPLPLLAGRYYLEDLKANLKGVSAIEMEKIAMAVAEVCEERGRKNEADFVRYKFKQLICGNEVQNLN
jgi:hypothetical protein